MVDHANTQLSPQARAELEGQLQEALADAAWHEAASGEAHRYAAVLRAVLERRGGSTRYRQSTPKASAADQQLFGAVVPEEPNATTRITEFYRAHAADRPSEFIRWQEVADELADCKRDNIRRTCSRLASNERRVLERRGQMYRLAEAYRNHSADGDCPTDLEEARRARSA